MYIGGKAIDVTIYHRNSSRIDTSEPLQLSLVLVHAIFLFHFSPPTFLFYFYPSFSRARVFALLLLERPTDHRCDPFEFSSLKLLYTFSCSKVLDSPPILAAFSDAFAHNVTALLHRSYLQCCYFEILTTGQGPTRGSSILDALKLVKLKSFSA